jgi:hypothetical protein
MPYIGNMQTPRIDGKSVRTFFVNKHQLFMYYTHMVGTQAAVKIRQKIGGAGL